MLRHLPKYLAPQSFGLPSRALRHHGSFSRKRSCEAYTCNAGACYHRLNHVSGHKAGVAGVYNRAPTKRKRWPHWPDGRSGALASGRVLRSVALEAEKLAVCSRRNLSTTSRQCAGAMPSAIHADAKSRSRNGGHRPALTYMQAIVALRRARVITAELISDVIAQACLRFAAHGAAANGHAG
jgi:hypothetical protein